MLQFRAKMNRLVKQEEGDNESLGAILGYYT